MKKPPEGEPEKEIYGTHIGDIGVIVVAALISLVLVLILVLPSPFAKLERAQAEQAKVERQKAIDKAVASGEVSVSISPAKHH